MCCNVISEMAKKFAEVQFVIKDCAKCGIFVDDRNIYVNGEYLKFKMEIANKITKRNMEKFFYEMKCIGYEIQDYEIWVYRSYFKSNDKMYINFEFRYVGGE